MYGLVKTLSLCPKLLKLEKLGIAAGSVVTKNVLPNTIVAGNPAKVIKNL